MVGITSIANYHPTAFRSRDGTLWFATAQSAVAIDPARFPRELPVPPVEGAAPSAPIGGRHRRMSKN